MSPRTPCNLWGVLLGHLTIPLLFQAGFCHEAKFTLTPGVRIISGVDQLASVSNPVMTSIFCAVVCRRNSGCDLFHFSTLNNVCVILKEQAEFDPFNHLISDTDWSVGFIKNSSASVRRGMWTMVFRAQSRIGVSAYNTWFNTGLQHDLGGVSADFPRACLGLTDYAQCDRHYRSHILDNWVNIQKVRYSLVKSGVEVAYIVFDGTGTDNRSWFSQSRILNSTWSPQLDTDPDLEPVGIEGTCDARSCRRFRIYQTYNYCPYEFFYTFIVDMAYDVCNTGTLNWHPVDLSTFPVFFYSAGSGPSSLGIDGGQYDPADEADVLSVWVKFV